MDRTFTPLPDELLQKQIPMHDSPLKWIIIAVIIFCVGIVGIYFIGNKNSIFTPGGPMSPTAAPSPTTAFSTITVPVMPTDALVPTPSDNWSAYVYPGFDAKDRWEGFPWKGFTLYFPSSWSVAEENFSPEPKTFSLTVKKTDGSSLRVVQGFGEGGTCLFPGDPEYDTFNGAGIKLGEFIQIDKTDAVKYRIGKSLEKSLPQSYSVCFWDKDKYASGNGDVMGISSIEIKNQEALDDVVEMLKRFEIGS